MKKLFLASLLLALMLGLSAPASANIELILQPLGNDWNTNPNPEITVTPSTVFTLELGFAVSDGDQIGDGGNLGLMGLKLKLAYEPTLDEVIEGPRFSYPPFWPAGDGPVRDPTLYPDIFAWPDAVSYANEITTPGLITYEAGIDLAQTPYTFGPGYYKIGEVVFHCLAEGPPELKGPIPGNLTTGEGSFYYEGGVGYGNTKTVFDGYTGTIVNQVPIPEPATMLLLGTGLLGLVSGLRKRKS